MILGILLLILMNKTLVSPVHADDKVLLEGKTHWKYVDKLRQDAVIGRSGSDQEALLLRVSVDTLGKRGIWVFPVPSRPEDIKVDILDSFPRIVGRSYDDYVLDSLSGVVGLLPAFHSLSPAAVRLFALRAWVTFVVWGIGADSDFMDDGNVIFRNVLLIGEYSDFMDGGNDHGISVHQAFSKLGLTTQVVTATDENRLFDYLSKRGLRLDPSEKEIWASYQNGGLYSFIVSSFEGGDDSKSDQAIQDLSLVVHFKTQRLYFPLLASKAGNDRPISVSLQVIGDIRAEIPETLRESTTTKLFFANTSDSTNQIRNLGLNVEENLGNSAFTEVSLVDILGNFTGDIWFLPNSIPIRWFHSSVYTLLSRNLVLFASSLLVSAGILCFLPFLCRHLLGTRGVLYYGLVALISGLPLATLFLARRVDGRKSAGPMPLKLKCIFGLGFLSAFSDLLFPPSALFLELIASADHPGSADYPGVAGWGIALDLIVSAGYPKSEVEGKFVLLDIVERLWRLVQGYPGALFMVGSLLLSVIVFLVAISQLRRALRT